MKGTERKYAEQKKRGWAVNLLFFKNIVQNNGEPALDMPKDRLEPLNGLISTHMEMILAVNIEFCRGFSYTTRLRRQNNGNGGRLYAGFPKKQG